MLMSQDQNEGQSHNIEMDITAPLKGQKSSDIWEQP